MGLVVGVENGGLQATKGSVARHTRARIVCFLQHAVEALEEKGKLDGELTALREMMQVTVGSMSEQEARGVLGGLGLPGKIASDVLVAALSGGQKVRLALAKLVYSPPHLLVLDEVTTHLDSDTVLALVETLKQYQGALLIITHNIFFMRCVVEGESLNGKESDEEKDLEEEDKEEWGAKPGMKVDISTKELSGGARIYYIFNDVFGQALASIDATHNLENQDIRTAIRNSTGPRPSLFVPEIAFDLLVKPQIKPLEAPSLRCVELVYEELVKICHNCTSAVSQTTRPAVSELLQERLGPTSEYAQSLIEIQAAYINTNHPAFITGSALAAQQANTRQRSPATPQPSSNEPVNGNGLSLEDEDETSSEDSIFPPRDDRSVSSTVHDRSRSSISASTTTPAMAIGMDTVAKRSSSRSRRQSQIQHRDHHRPHSALGGGPMPNGADSSPPTARETFLHYFFASMRDKRARVKALLDAYKEAFKTLSDVNLKSS
ncbi:hypothetical protein D9615_010193 [Tricholomella constricta]|uniref:ABC transporter domain-containing protein n=1 Tax=Tricholomella constricta TaxID=117010 RepID=A0A8H5LS96_9AGAR|nr:hypothetical protein D9615_010193 [Tricholomella constricta]